MVCAAGSLWYSESPQSRKSLLSQRDSRRQATYMPALNGRCPPHTWNLSLGSRLRRRTDDRYVAEGDRSQYSHEQWQSLHSRHLLANHERQQWVVSSPPPLAATDCGFNWSVQADRSSRIGMMVN